MNPIRENGRRCMTEDEMRAKGLVPNARGLWQDVKNAERIRKHFAKA